MESDWDDELIEWKNHHSKWSVYLSLSFIREEVDVIRFPVVTASDVHLPTMVAIGYRLLLFVYCSPPVIKHARYAHIFDMEKKFEHDTLSPIVEYFCWWFNISHILLFAVWPYQFHSKTNDKWMRIHSHQRIP